MYTTPFSLHFCPDISQLADRGSRGGGKMVKVKVVSAARSRAHKGLPDYAVSRFIGNKLRLSDIPIRQLAEYRERAKSGALK